MSQPGVSSNDFILRASARFTCKKWSVFIALLSLLLYIGSDFLSKILLSNIPVSWVSLFRFGFGVPLLLCCNFHAFKNRKVITFASANIINSICGVYAILAGSLSGFALAGQLSPVFIVFFSVILFKLTYNMKSWLLFSIIVIISHFLFAFDKNIGSQANYIYIGSVAFQAFVFSRLCRNNDSLVSYLAVYNTYGFILTPLYIFYNQLPFPDTLSIHGLVLSGILAMAGSILSIISLATPFRVEVSSVSYIRLPLTLLLSWLLLGESTPALTWGGCTIILLLVYLLNKTASMKK
ncbi:hypothetical protein [Symbiopectobacterium purcellii]|uniref:EamA domain-containing protein n=1 Tax=Symbiopectobacterium purcellii TaxID=2871826 RepID=A0ABX9ATW7_9ENTR|nr:hypothetical protein [Symbiopectobacterium purcellii]QZN97431.1 hypothetical protein K6K13_08925 [Symbiopectobacterium purcellii]